MNNSLNCYRVYLDISGNIGKEDFFVGVIIFNEKYRKKFLGEFQNRFPNLHSFKKKGTSLTEAKLKEVIKFMNEKRINMTCLHFPKQKLIDTETLIESKLRALTGKNPVVSFLEKEF